MRPRVVGVHGIGNHLPKYEPAEAAARLTRVWSHKLACDVDLTVAYYAHHLHGAVRQSGFDLDLLDEQERATVAEWAYQTLGPETAQSVLTLPIRQLVAAVASRYRLSAKVLEPFIALFAQEVRQYLRNPDRRTGARDEVAAVIRDQQPSVVLAHSLGSVVAYEALCANPDLEVDLLVTLGSPLAIRNVVFDRLEPSPNGARPVPKPKNVGRWANVSDVGDVVAIPRPLRDTFAVHPDIETTIGLFDFHSVAKYLGCAEVRGLLTSS